MKNGYKHLGQYIEQIDVRNKDLAINKLLGVRLQSPSFRPLQILSVQTFLITK